MPNDDDLRRIGGRVYEERKKRGWSQGVIVERANAALAARGSTQRITQRWMSLLEHGLIGRSSIERLAIIALVMELPASALLLDPDPKESDRDRHLRMVLRMHNVDPATAEDVVRAFAIIEDSEAKDGTTPHEITLPSGSRPSRSPSNDTETPPR